MTGLNKLFQKRRRPVFFPQLSMQVFQDRQHRIQREIASIVKSIPDEGLTKMLPVFRVLYPVR